MMATDVEALDEPRRLHEERDENIAEHERRHALGGPVPAENVGEALGEPPFIPRPGQQADVIYKPRQRHEEQRQPFQTEIGADFIRAKGLFIHH